MNKRDRIRERTRHNLEIKRRPPRFSPTEVNRIRNEYMLESTTQEKLAIKYNASISTIRRIMLYEGVYGTTPYR